MTQHQFQDLVAQCLLDNLSYCVTDNQFFVWRLERWERVA